MDYVNRNCVEVSGTSPSVRLLDRVPSIMKVNTMEISRTLLTKILNMEIFLSVSIRMLN